MVRGSTQLMSLHAKLRRRLHDRRLAPSTAVVALALALGSCSWVSDQMDGTMLQGGWLDPATFWGTEPEPQTLSAEAQTDESQPFPNLSTVPDEAPATTSSGERTQIAEGLSSDRSNAEYTDEALTGQPSNVASAAPPPPAEGTTPSLAEAMPEPSMESPVEPTLTQEAAVPPPSESSVVSVDMSALDTPAPAPVPAPIAEEATPSVMASAPAPAPAPAATGVGQPIGLIYFEHGSASLDREAHSVLRNIAQIAQSGGTVQIIGHASMRTKTMDLTDHKLVNFDVSVQRAGAVANELIRLGVRPEQVQIAGAGDQLPVFAEFMPTGEAGNRRTEIYLYQ
jgi:outer membrane protein OmpA-like peptidoglycan-associated protein